LNPNQNPAQYWGIIYCHSPYRRSRHARKEPYLTFRLFPKSKGISGSPYKTVQVNNFNQLHIMASICTW
jgi:hypothetical protein